LRVNLAVPLCSCLALVLVANGGGYVAKQISPAARAEGSPAEGLAAELRRQGHRCEAPVAAEQDVERSRPDGPVWVVKCTNATYRMRLVPHQAAHVEQI
jgi:hypothetical protein